LGRLRPGDRIGRDSHAAGNPDWRNGQLVEQGVGYRVRPDEVSFDGSDAKWKINPTSMPQSPIISI
jgi:hypothetical protein